MSIRQKLKEWKQDAAEVKKRKRRKKVKVEKLSERDIKELMSARSYERHNGAVRSRGM